MISIRHSVNELEKCHRQREIALDCYVAAIRNLSAYTIEFDPAVCATQRQYLSSLAAEVAGGADAALADSQPALRGLLRDYRDKAAEYLDTLREELSGTARALEEILDSIGQTDGDHESRVKSAVARLREIASAPGLQEAHAAIAAASNEIEESIELMRKHHRLTIAQFQIEIRMLHKRIDSMEASACLDQLTQLYSRGEIEERIRSAAPEAFLLLVRVNGFRTAETQFPEQVAAELAGAFAKRLRNCTAPATAIGRWSYEEFVAILDGPKKDVMATAKWISEHLSGAYACLLAGKTVRPALQINVAVLEVAGHTPERLMEKVGAFLTGQRP